MFLGESADAESYLLHFSFEEPVDGRMLAAGKQHVQGAFRDVHAVEVRDESDGMAVDGDA